MLFRASVIAANNKGSSIGASTDIYAVSARKPCHMLLKIEKKADYPVLSPVIRPIYSKKLSTSAHGLAVRYYLNSSCESTNTKNNVNILTPDLSVNVIKHFIVNEFFLIQYFSYTNA